MFPEAREGVDWRLRDLLFASLLSLVFMLALTALAMRSLLANRWNTVVLGVNLEAVAVLPAVLLIARRRGAKHLRQFGLGRYPWPKGLCWGAAGGLGLFLLVQGCGSLLEFLGVHLAPQQLLTDTLLAHRSVSRLLIFLGVAAVVAPFWEEVFFRGLVYQVLRHRWGAVVAGVLSGLLFALLHAEPFLVRLPVFALGLCLAFLFEQAGSLYVPIIAHGVANALSVLLAYFGGA